LFLECPDTTKVKISVIHYRISGLALEVVASPGEVFAHLSSLKGCIFWVVSGSWLDLTLDNLMKQHVIVIDRCYMCKKIAESVDNLLLHCDMASSLWSSFFSRFGMSWVMPRRFIVLLACWWFSGRPKSVVV